MPILELSPGFHLHYIDNNPSGCVPVLLLHGLGASGESWVFQIPSLTKAGCRVLAPDMRGFGKSCYPGKLSIARMAGDMAEFLRQLEAAPCSVVGISMGGTVAQELALNHPGLVNKLVLVNTFASLRPKKPSVWLYYAIRFLLVHLLSQSTQAELVSQRIFPKPDQKVLRQNLTQQIKQANPAAYRAAMRSLAVFNSEDRLGQISQPTLVITGVADNTVPPEAQTKLAERIPHCKHISIANCGHGASVECPREFNHILLGFISKNQNINPVNHE